MHALKTRLGALLLSGILLAGSVQAATITPSVTDVALTAGETTFSFDLELSQNTPFSGAEFGIRLPEGATLTRVDYLDPAMQNASHTPQVVRDDTVYFGFFAGENRFQGEYQVARLTFQYTGSGDTSITLADSNVVALDDSGTAVGDDSSAPFTVSVRRVTSGGGSGSSSEITHNPDGSTTTTVTRPDGSVVQTTRRSDGASSTVVTDDGHADAEVTVPAAAVDKAADAGDAVALPLPPLAADADPETAPEITVHLGGRKDVAVELPVSNGSYGTVVLLEEADGSLELLRTAVPTETGVAAVLSDGDTIHLVDRSRTFGDVSGDRWSCDAVTFVTSRDLFQGTAANTFSPAAPMTRAMLWTVLARLEGVDTSTGSSWFSAGKDWAVSEGISDGSAADSPITREQLVTMLWRYSGSPAASSLAGFADSAAVSGWAHDAMAWAVAQGLVQGNEADQLQPQSKAAREQVAAILTRFLMAQMPD